MYPRPGDGARQSHWRDQVRARRSDTDGGQARGLTVNESEGPQEHDPGQPEGACAEAGREARGVVPWPRRRLRLQACVRGFPPPKLLPGRRHCGTSKGMRGERCAPGRPPPAERPRPFHPAGPLPGGHAHVRGAVARTEHARAPSRPCGAL